MAPPTEWHLGSMNFCGPGTNLTRRLSVNDEPITQPVDRIDEIAMWHDIYYRDHEGMADRYAADKEMIKKVKALGSLTCRETFEKYVVIVALSIKRFFVRMFLYCIRSNNVQ